MLKWTHNPGIPSLICLRREKMGKRMGGVEEGGRREGEKERAWRKLFQKHILEDSKLEISQLKMTHDHGIVSGRPVQGPCMRELASSGHHLPVMFPVPSPGHP